MSDTGPAVVRPDSASEKGTDPASAAAPPSRRSAIMRSGLILGILFVVFVVILPRYIDYSEVVAAFQALTLQQVLTISILGIIAWFVSGLVFSALIPRLSPLRGTQSWLILAGIGASVPFGPWNMGVLWVIVRGWGVANIPATSGIALYGIVNILSRLALPVVGVAVLAITDGIPSTTSAERAWAVALISIVVFFVATGLMIAIVRSEKVADWIGKKGQAIASWVLRRLGRKESPNVDGAIHRFRDQLGEVIRQRGLASIAVAILSQFAWAAVLTVALRMCGVPDRP